MDKRAVLWDMDGVLADTGELHYQTWARVLAGLDIPFDREKFRQIFGRHNRDVLTFLTGKVPDPPFLAWVAGQKEGAFRQMMRGQLSLLPGVQQWLERLREMGCRQAVASSAPPENIEALVDELGIRGYFEALVSSYDMPGKPDPAVFLEAARRLEAQPEQCIVIEDSLAGVEAAKRGSMFCIAVLTTNPKEALARADIVVQSLEDLQVEELCRRVGEAPPQGLVP